MDMNMLMQALMQQRMAGGAQGAGGIPMQGRLGAPQAPQAAVKYAITVS